MKVAILATKKKVIKKEFEDSTANGKKNENMDMQQMAENCIVNEEDAAEVIQKFEETIRNKKGGIVWLAYYQSKIFQKFRSKERFVNDMVSKFKLSKSTMVFKIALSSLIDDYPKIKDSSLSLYYFKKN